MDKTNTVEWWKDKAKHYEGLWLHLIHSERAATRENVELKRDNECLSEQRDGTASENVELKWRNQWLLKQRDETADIHTKMIAKLMEGLEHIGEWLPDESWESRTDKIVCLLKSTKKKRKRK